MPAAPEIAPRIRDSFARQSFMTSIGAEITLIGDGRVVVEAPVGSAFLQQQGFAHGGLLFTLADTAAGYAALTMMPPEVEVMTLEMKINLMAPASGRLRSEEHTSELQSLMRISYAVLCLNT